MNARVMAMMLCCFAIAFAKDTSAQDWPQWRGINRDAKVTGFRAPETWPKELTQVWKARVGDGVATPALVGNRLYVFSREDGHEVIRCLDAATGEEVWQDNYEAADADGPAARFPVLGPRSSPTVAEGKVVTLGARGTLSCLNAAGGKLLWRKDDFHSWPRFFVASSPIVVDGLCIAQLGEEGEGAIVAYDLATGQEKWRWADDGPAYGSPVLATIGDSQAIVAPTADNLVAIGVKDGKLLWEVPYKQGRYNAATPIIEDEMLVYAGPTRGMTAERLVQDGDKLSAKQLWSNPDNSVMYNTPILRDGRLIGLSTMNSLFCIHAQTGKTAWNAPLSAESRSEGGQAAAGERQQEQRRQQGREGGRRRRGGGSGGYGSVVDVGDVLLALTPSAELVVFRVDDQSATEVARYKVADGPTYSYPVVAGNRIFIKDKDSVTLWKVE